MDQAAGLRHLFAPSMPALLPLGCARGDDRDRACASALAAALRRHGRVPLLLDLTGDAGRGLLGADGAFDDLADFAFSLHRSRAAVGRSCDVLLVLADALRLADLVSGATDRLLLLAEADESALAHVYAQIKAVGLAHGMTRQVVAFRDAEPGRAASVHRRLADTAARFLGTTIEFGGVVGAGAASAWDRLAADACRWIRPVEQGLGCHPN
ncbi:MAG: hypothetical protein GX644_03290 [Limnobacter sp.]|nr:hypothetical protein [Limnobacter sp.]